MRSYFVVGLLAIAAGARAATEVDYGYGKVEETTPVATETSTYVYTSVEETTPVATETETYVPAYGEATTPVATVTETET
ncbi:hypothetical protein HDV00_012715, partial [Rhizophlyctis rosea]